MTILTTIRVTPYTDNHENCSVVQIDSDCDVTLYGRKLHNIQDTLVDYAKDKALFFYKDPHGRHSLNQDPEAPPSDFDPVYVPLNIAFDIFKAFKEIDEINRKKLDDLFERIRDTQPQEKTM